MATRYSVSAEIPAQVSTIFALLADPESHQAFDASGMVGAPETSTRLTAEGQVFVMNMTYRAGTRVEQYQSDNHVTAFVEPYLLEWATATHGGPELGWRWRYELEPILNGTRVHLSYDWSATSQQNVEQFGVPLVDENGLRESLSLLAAASTTSCHRPG